MNVRFDYRPYRRPFRQPLWTQHGKWHEREGLIVRLIDEQGRAGWGEIAPIPWFGSETLEQALEFCSQLPSRLNFDHIVTIPDCLPACQFGLETAWEERASSATQEARGNAEADELEQKHVEDLSGIACSVLLPTGKAALTGWQEFWQQGDRTFKWKIGVAALEEEIGLFQQLIANLPAGARLRLDANGALSLEETKRWLQVCEGFPVEYLEQPLPPDQFNDLLSLSSQSATPLALDESVATLAQLKHCYQQGWRGIYVIKPAIAGFPSRLRQFCQTDPIDAVFSSVFETPIGRRAGLRLAAELGNSDRAMGYGTAHWFEESAADEFDSITSILGTDLSLNSSLHGREVTQAGRSLWT